VLFGAGGAGPSWAIDKTIHDGMRAMDWVLVKATVDAFNRGQVSYRYTFQGREYKGDRMGSAILGGRDNLDSWHSDMASLLSAAQKEGKPISVFVNPDNPAESMIDRTIRWKLVLVFLPFALGFGGVGVGALWFLGKALVGESPSRMPQAAEIPAAPAASGAPGTSTVFARGMINDSAPASSSAAAATTSSIRSFDAVLGDDSAPAPAVPATVPSAATPDLEGVLKLFDKNAKLTPQQRAALAKLTPEQKAMLGKISNWAPSMKKWIIGLVGLIVALQFVPSILSYLRSL
jgi:hypothetical protein